MPFTVDHGYSVRTGEQLQHLHSKCVSEGETEFLTCQKLQGCYTEQVLIVHDTWMSWRSLSPSPFHTAPVCLEHF